MGYNDDSSIKEPTINTYGLKIGDVLNDKVIREWSSVPNSCNRHGNKWLGRSKGLFVGDRKIEAFEILDGIVGFLVSGTDRIHLRAEGFKEFAEGFNKPQFEVGRWYKYNNWYIKYKRHDIEGIWESSEEIDNKGIYGQRIGVFGSKDFDNEKVLLTDLSEIQQYLPDGHPDKIKTPQSEYIVGKWYKLGEWIAKFKELDEDKFCVF